MAHTKDARRRIGGRSRIDFEEGLVYSVGEDPGAPGKVGDSVPVDVTFAPTATQDYNDGEIHVISNDADTPDLTVKATGSGLDQIGRASCRERVCYVV